MAKHKSRDCSKLLSGSGKNSFFFQQLLLNSQCTE